MRRRVVVLMALLAFLPTGVEAGRTFNGSNQSINVTTAIVTGPPFTVCGWFRPANDTALLIPWHLHYGSSNGWIVRFRGDLAGDPVQFSSVDSGDASDAASVGIDIAANTWYHVCGSEITTASRAVWVNGANKGTNGTTRGAHSAATGQRLGARADGNFWWSGSIADVCLWNVALTDAEVAALYGGGSSLPCTRIRRANLVSCARLDSGASPEPDRCGPLSWALTNAPTVSTTMPSAPVWQAR